MRLLRFFALGLFLTASPAWAQENPSLYSVTDVNVDVTAANASQARDQGLLQAQRQAFEQLLTRLGAPASAAKASDDTIAKMVRSFEVQKEHASGQRYIGTLTLDFKPDAIRNLLNQKGVSYTESRPLPYVILPILHEKDREILWEDRTPWRDAWDEAPKEAGFVPLIAPAGDLADIAKISTAEAASAKAESLEALAQKYNAGGTLVVTLYAELGAPDAKLEGRIEAVRYDLGGRIHAPLTVKLVPGKSKNLSDELRTGVKSVIAALDASLRQDQAAGITPGAVSPPPGTEGGPVASSNATPPSGQTPSFLPVDATVPTLAAWAQIRNKLRQVPAVVSTNVITMTRGLVHAEIQFRGELGALQTALSEQGLILEQGASGGWEIRQNTVPGGM